MRNPIDLIPTIYLGPFLYSQRRLFCLTFPIPCSATNSGFFVIAIAAISGSTASSALTAPFTVALNALS